MVKQASRFMRKAEEGPVLRECPYCLSMMPLKATRCAHCTQQVPAA
jgi:large conductance mechanosensitive channel